MRLVLASAGEELYAFDPAQLAGILAWPLALDIPWRSLHELAGVDAEEPEPRLLLARSAASGTPFALRVPGALREEDVAFEAVHPVPPLLHAPPWVRGFVLRGGAPAPLLDLPLVGDAVLSLPKLPIPEEPS